MALTIARNGRQAKELVRDQPDARHWGSWVVENGSLSHYRLADLCHERTHISAGQAVCPFLLALGQIDPVKRELIQFGYNAPLEGHPPLSAYAFYYRNQPDFLHTNLTLRLAIAPTYVDSELGISQALGAHTDLGIGVAG